MSASILLIRVLMDLFFAGMVEFFICGTICATAFANYMEYRSIFRAIQCLQILEAVTGRARYLGKATDKQEKYCGKLNVF